MNAKVETRLLKPTPEALALAAELLRAGELVAFPTETVYGLGANALDPAAVLKIFAAKNRPADNPLIVHIAEREQLNGLCEVTPTAENLMDAFWPGPLTLLLPKTAAVPDAVTAGLVSVGVRMPSHPVARELLRACALPIAAPSANTSTRPIPTAARHVLEDMDGRIPLILDGGDCEVGVESTVLDLTGEEPEVLRPGAVTPEMIAAVAGVCAVADSVMRPLREGETAPSPGMKHRHYAPKGRMTVYRGRPERVAERIRREYDRAENACILAYREHIPQYGDRRVWELGRDEAGAAHSIFALLRRADEQGISRILAEGVRDEGVGLALMNRMARAAAFDIVEAED